MRGAVRLLMLLFAQATAITLVFLMVNNANNLYDNWADLLGTGDHVQTAADLGADGTGGIALHRLPKVKQTFRKASGPGMRAAGGVQVTRLRGRVSGVDAEVYVWLPPQYHEPAYRHRAFPVVELLPGYPAHQGLVRFAARDRATAAVDEERPDHALHPGGAAHEPRPRRGHRLRQHPGPGQRGLWLSIDVPKMVMDNFRAESGPGGWAVAGYSAGAHCATKLAVAHPDRYHAAVSMSGYNDPMAEPVSLTAQDPRLRAANNPYLLLKNAPVPPAVALYFSGESGDGYQTGMAMKKVAKSPTTVDVVYLPRSAGGHNMALWRPQVITVFRWLTQQFDAGDRKPGAGTTTRTLPHEPSSAGSRRAAPASGTASRAAAGRKR